jgi:hypothetical protein
VVTFDAPQLRAPTYLEIITVATNRNKERVESASKQGRRSKAIQLKYYSLASDTLGRILTAATCPAAIMSVCQLTHAKLSVAEDPDDAYDYTAS